MEFDRLYSGFDGLDVAFQGRIPAALVAKLEAAKTEAGATNRPTLIEHGGVHLHVAETGARGGYAYRCDTGEDGATWFFKRGDKVTDWNIRVSCKSLALASKGIWGVRDELYAVLEALGADVLAASIGRVDYCLDVVAPKDFVLDPQHFIAHSHANISDVLVRASGKSGVYTSVTIGEMPGRQVIVYDKKAEIIAHQKPYWWDIWNAHRAAEGKPPLDRSDKSLRIYRVELRAGKRHLKEDCGIADWGDLEAKLGNVLLWALAAVRLTIDGDSHRTRRRLHPLWTMATGTVNERLWDMRELPVGRILMVRRQKVEAQMKALITGLAASYAVASGADLFTVHEKISEELGSFIKSNRKEFLAKMKRARDKYWFICEEDSHAEGEGGNTAPECGRREGGLCLGDEGRGECLGRYDLGHHHRDCEPVGRERRQ